MTIGVITGIVILSGILLLARANRSTGFDYSGYPELAVTSPSFPNGTIPVEFTGNGADRSPALVLADVSEKAVSMAVIMDDLDVPVAGILNHWTIWNIPPRDALPEGISHGATVPELDNAIQGVGYGRHRYRGPKPPFGSHRYRFHVFVLDTMLDLEDTSGKKDLLAAMDGHILQYGSVTGVYPGEKPE